MIEWKGKKILWHSKVWEGSVDLGGEGTIFILVLLKDWRHFGTKMKHGDCPGIVAILSTSEEIL